MVTFSEEFEHIKAAINNDPKSDPGRLETCLSIALEALRDIASHQRPCECGECGKFYAPSDEAEKAMAAVRRMEMRVRLGDDIRPGSEMSLPYEDVLSPGPGGGDWG